MVIHHDDENDVMVNDNKNKCNKIFLHITCYSSPNIITICFLISNNIVQIRHWFFIYEQLI